MRRKIIFCIIILSGLILFVGSANAQYSSCAPCTSSQTCQVDTETGLYSCIDNTSSSTSSGPYSTCAPCTSSQTCQVDTETGLYSCIDNGSTSSSSSTSSTSSSSGCGSGFEEIGGVCFPTSTNLPDPSGGIATIITNILYWVLSIFGILAIIAFIISGLQYILSTGNEETLDNAKRSMKWSVVGVAVALSGLVIIYAIDKMLRGYSNF